jgi:hypothetical protein
MTTGSLMAKSVNATNGIVPIIEGALYQRGTGSAMTEIAEVVEVGKDRMGIPHVRFTMHLMRGDYITPGSETRTLALDIFYARYKNRVQ